MPRISRSAVATLFYVLFVQVSRTVARASTCGLLFLGVHCLAIGWLILRSRFLPRALGIGMIVAGLCYLTDGIGGLLLPSVAFAYDILWLAHLAELTLCLWLLVAGINTHEWQRARAHQLRQKCATD